jgi:hypothetical protein
MKWLGARLLGCLAVTAAVAAAAENASELQEAVALLESMPTCGVSGCFPEMVQWQLGIRNVTDVSCRHSELAS